MSIQRPAEFGLLAESLSAIEILRLPPHYDDRRSDLAHGLSGEVLARLVSNDALDLLALLSALPAAEQMRCHIPRYGLRLLLQDAPEASVALCFECNNGRTFLALDEGWITFDGSSHQAELLLAAIREYDDENTRR